MALKKALYKPGAFFKGVVLPLLDGGTCTIREAAIVGSVLRFVARAVTSLFVTRFAQESSHTNAALSRRLAETVRNTLLGSRDYHNSRSHR